MSINSGGKPPFSPEEFKSALETYKAAKNFKADPETDIKAKYFGSEPTAKTSDGKVKKIKKSFQQSQIQEDYKPDSKEIKASKIPEPPSRVPLNPKSAPKDLPKLPTEKPNILAKDVLRTSKSISNKPSIKQDELSHNPLMMKMRKKADYEGEIKQNPEDVKAEKEFSDKAKGFGYRFDTDFEMYLPINDDGSKEALTKEEMTDMVEGKNVRQSSSKPREIKFEGRTTEMDSFAEESSYKFDSDIGMYVSNNPFVELESQTIDDMKDMMDKASDKKKIDETALEQGYKPIPDMDGFYMNVNDNTDMKIADDFR